MVTKEAWTEEQCSKVNYTDDKEFYRHKYAHRHLCTEVPEPNITSNCTTAPFFEVELALAAKKARESAFFDNPY
jgi:hypothetical protein